MRLTARHIALALSLLAVVAVLALSRVNHASDTTRPLGDGQSTAGSVAVDGTATGSTTTPTPSADPSEHGVAVNPPPRREPTENEAVEQAAASFAAAWLNTFGKTPQQWRDALTPRVTADLAEQLAIADPATVPTSAKVSGDLKVTTEGDLFNADVPIAATDGTRKIGDLNLTLVQRGGKYLVTEIDWTVAA